MSKIRDHLPLSSLCLLVPPLRLMSACMWQVALERNVYQYNKLAEIISLVTEMVPQLMSYKQRTQLILGLKARIIFELLKRMDPADCATIQNQLNIFEMTAKNCTDKEDQDGEVEMSKSEFVKLVQTLLSDKYEKDKFFKEDFPTLYGARFDTALQILVWEFLYRLEEFTPVPSFSKVSTMFELSVFDNQFDQCVCEPEELKKILQHQKQQQKLNKSEFSFMSDTILSALSSKQTSVASEDHFYTIVDGKSGDSSDEETDNSSTEPYPSNSQLGERGLSPLTTSCFEEASVAGHNNHDASVVPQRTFCFHQSSHKKDETHVKQIKQEPAADSTRVQDSHSTGKLNPTLCGSSEDAENCACLECGKRFKKHATLRRSTIRIGHPVPENELHRCDKCEKTFQTKRRLEQHLQAHAKVKPYICSYCGKGLPCAQVLKTHLRLHTGERPYACKYCDKKFDQAYGLTQHIRLHSGEKPFLCSECGKAFSNSSAFLVHSRVHTDERPYRCKDCGKRYITLQRLKVHQRYHTGERPFMCSECGKSFRLNSGLSRHRRIHTGERPYRCLLCDKGFCQSYNLKVHMQSHKNKNVRQATD